MSTTNNQCAKIIECSEPAEKTTDDSGSVVSEYKQLDEKCEKVLKRIKGRKARRGRAKKSK